MKKAYLIITILTLSFSSFSKDIEEITVSKNLNKGWNLVGFYWDNAQNVDSALSQIWDKIETVKSMDAFYSKNHPPYLNSLNSLTYGEGYFIKVTEPCQLQWTSIRYNYEPEKPLSLISETYSHSVDTSFYLRWQSYDVNDETLTYTVILDGNFPPQTTLASEIIVDSLLIHGLKHDTTLYWQVIVTDEYGHSVESEIFSFTTNDGTMTHLDIDGNRYQTIVVGNQEWMTKNLKTTKYNDGTPIEFYGDNVTDWVDNTSGAYTWCNNDETINKDKYGALYNWYTIDSSANGGKNICPVGFHVPSINEWDELITYLGGSSVAGGKLKITGTKLWEDPNTGATDEVGFSAVPGGRTDGNGGYAYYGSYGDWWSSTEYSATYAKANGVYIGNSKSSITTTNFKKHYGLSVRCIKDMIDVPAPLPPIAEFTVDSTTISLGKNISFTDQSTGAATSWHWDFGDGNTSTAQNPTHAYTVIGSYTVTLRAYNRGGLNTVTKSDYINVLQRPVILDSVADIDGNKYRTVLICAQEWFAEDLKVTKFNDGTSLSYVTKPQLENTMDPAYTWYEDNPDVQDSGFGAMYNEFVVTNGNICPAGWHISTIDDWTELIGCLSNNGFSESSTALKSKDLWDTGLTGTDDFAFAALPNGMGGFTSYIGEGTKGYWWFPDDGRGIGNTIATEGTSFWFRIFRNEQYVQSIRCVRD